MLNKNSGRKLASTNKSQNRGGSLKSGAGVGNPSFKQKMGYGKMGFSKDGKDGNDGKDGFLSIQRWERWVFIVAKMGKMGFKSPKDGKDGFQTIKF